MSFMEPTGYRLVGSRRETATFRLVCFHHAGGSPSAYLALQRCLPPAWFVTCVRLTRDGVDPGTLVSLVASKLAEDPSPTVFFGHSMGALFAYHVAVAAEALAYSSLACVVLSSCSPRIEDNKTSPNATFWELLYDLVYLGGLPRTVASNETALRHAVSAYAHDLTFFRSLLAMHSESLQTRLLYVAGDADRSVDRDAAAAWAGLAGSAVERHVLPGNHFYFHSDAADDLARLFVALLSPESSGRGTGRET